MSQNNNSPVTEHFWSLINKADRRFLRVRDLPNYGRNRNDVDIQKAFTLYTRLWKMQQEHRQMLTDAGLKRWEIGEIASRIAQLYHGQYQRTADSGYLAEAYIFYEAILTRDYFRDATVPEDPALANKKLRFLARFLVVCLVFGRRDMVPLLVGHLRTLVDDCRRTFHEAESKEWKHVVKEIAKFLNSDSSFMNMRPLRYSYVYDTHPDSLPSVASDHVHRRLVLRDALLSSYYINENKFTELTLDTFRMLQCLEWEPRGSFALKGGGDSSHNETGPNRLNPLQDIRDPTLPLNPRKVILYRPSITHFLMVLATLCEELPADGILFIYLSSSGESQSKLNSSYVSSESTEKIGEASSTQPAFQNKENDTRNHETCLWLGARGTEGSKYLYPCDLIPSTRKPLFLVIDSPDSHAFKVIHGSEKGETAAMLLSPRLRSSAATSADSSVHFQYESQFTMFLTAPVQAFCSMIGTSRINLDKETYNNAEKLFSVSLAEWETDLLTSTSLHPIWVEVLGDPLLRRFLLRFIFCRAVLALYSPTQGREVFLPSCLPYLPESVNPETPSSQAAVRRLANFFDASSYFVFTDETTVLPQSDSDEPLEVEEFDADHSNGVNGW